MTTNEAIDILKKIHEESCKFAYDHPCWTCVDYRCEYCNALSIAIGMLTLDTLTDI